MKLEIENVLPSCRPVKQDFFYNNKADRFRWDGICMEGYNTEGFITFCACMSMYTWAGRTVSSTSTKKREIESSRRESFFGQAWLAGL